MTIGDVIGYVTWLVWIVQTRNQVLVTPAKIKNDVTINLFLSKDVF